MTIKRGAHAVWLVICNWRDNCESNDTYPSNMSLPGVVDAIKRRGWMGRNPYGAWRHTCPICEAAKLDARVDRERLHA